MKAAWILLCGSLVALAQSTSTDQTGSITGVVRDSVTRMPVKKVTVTINPVMVRGNANPGQQGSSTDASGTFAIASLPPGTYMLQFQHQSFPQARFGGVNKTVEVKAGETTPPLGIDLIPGAAVSGRIVDEDGEPLRGCFVQAHPATNPEQGASMSGNLTSNEEGDFRFYGVAAGKYIVHAQCQATLFQPRPFSAGPDPPPSHGYPIQYYPLATDTKGAQVIELLPGMEKSGVDFRMRPAPIMQIHGMFSSAGADWKGRNVILQLTSDTARRNGPSSGAAVNQAKGTFDFRQVFAGSYTLTAFSAGQDDVRVGAVQHVDVTDKPIELMVELRHAIDLGGTIEIESNATNANAPSATPPGQAFSRSSGAFSRLSAMPGVNGKPSPANFNIQLMPVVQVGMPFPQAQIKEDGSFTIKGIIPGEWRLNVNGQGFVKAAWMGPTEITDTLDLSSGAGGPLRIVISTNTASIRGTGSPGRMVFLQREGGSNGSMRMGISIDGQFSMGGLAPGKYRIGVLQTGSQNLDEGGQEITLKEGETFSIDLKPPAQ